MSDKNIDKEIENIQSGLKNLKDNAEKPLNNDRLTGERVFAEIVAGLIFGTLVGYFVDDYFHTAPIFLISLIILGLAASIYNIYKATNE